MTTAREHRLDDLAAMADEVARLGATIRRHAGTGRRADAEIDTAEACTTVATLAKRIVWEIESLEYRLDLLEAWRDEERERQAGQEGR